VSETGGGRRHQVVLIPAYRPGVSLIDLVTSLAGYGFGSIIVVDDGSGPGYVESFERCVAVPGVRVLRHEKNLGKGAALKSGIQHALKLLPECTGIVTADSDGQHLPGDIAAVAGELARHPDCLILGVREFKGKVPLRSWIGNSLTRVAVRLFMGLSLQDTQTGLRGLPVMLLPHLLTIASRGYEFELDMLSAAKHHKCRIIEHPVQTVYLNDNRSSHFNPLRDSIRIYFVLLRFSGLSLLTALLDNLVFLVAYRLSASVLFSQVTGRSIAVVFNYSLARRSVFLSRERHASLFPRYLFLVVAFGIASYGLIRWLTGALPVGVIRAKILAEAILFALSFLAQRDFVFTRRREPESATDWDRYYESVPFTALLTRKYTVRMLAAALRKYAGVSAGQTLVEFGGANSCFLARIQHEFRPCAYHIVDTNRFGLDLLRRRLDDAGNVFLHEKDVRGHALDVSADVVFSVGLIEHFDQTSTRKAIRAHFTPLRPGGYAIISFPTPTPLYRATRLLAERLGLWRFHDERPLESDEVLESVRDLGEVIFQKTLWPLIFTQKLMVIRKTGESALSGAQ
jgi:glycosyltransferase involved in cell wall biosynthesis/SAM-dependent methyltransferase